MSLTLNMVGGGGGKLKNTDAILSVTVPTGSAITATKGAVTLTPTIWTKADDNTLDVGIFIIHASQFDNNPWTVTATLGTQTASNTVVIDTADEYAITLEYGLYIYNRGVISPIASGLAVGRNDGITPTRTANFDSYYMKGVGSGYYGANGTVVSDVTISLAEYSTLHAVFSAFSKTSGNAFAQVGVTQNKGNAFNPIWQGVPTPNTEVTVDVSQQQGSYYIGFGGGGNTNQTWEFNIIKLWLT